MADVTRGGKYQRFYSKTFNQHMAVLEFERNKPLLKKDVLICRDSTRLPVLTRLKKSTMYV